MTDNVPSSNATLAQRPVLFLDLGALCLSAPFGGHDAQLALACALEGSGRLNEQPEFLTRLFDAEAIALLAKIDLEFHPHYVLATRWWWLFSTREIASVFAGCGIRFVWTNLHENWATQTTYPPDDRWLEIKNWILAHPESAAKWVVLNGETSGKGLISACQLKDLRPFIVLCDANVGLTESEYAQLRAAFELRANYGAR